MKRSEVRRRDLAKALAERSGTKGKALTEGQAQDELDRLVHGIVTRLRQGRPAEMPGVGIMAAKPVAKKNATPAVRKSKS